MTSGFDLLPNDVIFEILSNLSAIEIARCRTVCRRIFEGSKTRYVWINVFRRAECLLPPLDLNTVPLPELERIVIRMEIIDAKWTGTRLLAPRIYEDFLESTGDVVVCVMPPYIVRGCSGLRPVTAWFHKDETTGRKVFEHRAPEGWKTTRYFSAENGALYIVSISGTKFAITRYQVFGNDSHIIKMLEHNIDVPAVKHPRTVSKISSCMGGYMLIFPPDVYPGESDMKIIHLDTGRLFSCPLHVRDCAFKCDRMS
ncbi:hypothetical protein AN958_02721 [Leucoagaricus sp. SymC.cos]|nr:hypothetical protein AN958_02721 [Leucoagaricus sp. SymC.cos]